VTDPRLLWDEVPRCDVLHQRASNTAPRDGTLIRPHCRAGPAPIVGYWSRTFIGWVAYHEPIPLIRHDVAGWEPIADQAAARAVPLEQVGGQGPRPWCWAR
jgi:hypothetical protein